MNRIYSLAFLAITFFAKPFTVSGQDAPPLAEFLPAHAAVYVGISSADELTSKAQQTDFAKILSLPGIKEYVQQFQSRLSAAPSASSSALDFFSQLGSGGNKAALVICEGPRSSAEIALLIETGAQLSKYQANLANLKASLTQGGFSPLSPAPVGGIVAYEKLVTGAAPMAFCWFQSSNYVCISNNLKLAQVIQVNLQSAEGAKAESLAKSGVCAECLKKCDKLKAADIWFYAVPTGIAQLTQSDPDDGIEPRDFMKKHGLHQIEAIAAKLQLAQGNREVEYDIFVRTARPYINSMQMLALIPTAKLEPPAWLDDSANNLVQFQWTAQEMLRGLNGPFDDAMQDPGSFAQMLEEMKTDIGPGVDLQKEIFDNLEAPLVLFGKSEGAVNGSSEHTFAAVKVKNESQVASAVKRLFIEDSNAVREAVGAVDLWKIGGKKPIGAKQQGVRFRSSGIAVTDGYLFMSSSADGLRRLLAGLSTPKTPLTKGEEYARAKNELGPSADDPAIYRLYYSIARDMQTTYMLLKEGKVEKAESIYAQLLAPMIKADRQRGAAYDFSRLPDFKEVSKYLGTAFANGVDTPDGWKVHGFVLKNAAAAPAK